MSFRMEHWSNEGRWEPMDVGPAGRAWRSRPTAEEAVAHCIAWTGGTGIPAMQVVHEATGRVVWRDSLEYPDAGPSVRIGQTEPTEGAQAALDLGGS